jgi:hypothetical protein
MSQDASCTSTMRLVTAVGGTPASACPRALPREFTLGTYHGNGDVGLFVQVGSYLPSTSIPGERRAHRLHVFLVVLP